jgi:hypothetical protein
MNIQTKFHAFKKNPKVSALFSYSFQTAINTSSYGEKTVRIRAGREYC